MISDLLQLPLKDRAVYDETSGDGIHPGGRSYDSRQIDAVEAESRRQDRCQGPLTLNLRWPSLHRKSSLGIPPIVP